MMNARRVTTLFAVLLACMSLGASCSGGSAEPTTSEDHAERPAPSDSDAPRVESLVSVDVDELSRAERRLWVELINDQLSPCGDPVSVGACAQESSSCRACVPAARYLSRLVTEGYEREEIEELFEMRYGADSQLEIDVEGAPMRGSPMAQVTLVVFSDFECPYCGRAHPVLQQVLNRFEGRVRMVFKHYPLSGHARALPAARAAVAAMNQGKFWEMHDMLFEHQRQLEEEDLVGYAEEVGLDMDRFRADMQSSDVQARIDADRADGQELDISGTPAIFVSGRRFREPPSSLSAYIAETLDQ